MTTRCGLHQELELLDIELEKLNAQRKACFDTYRSDLGEKGWNKNQIRDEIDAFKRAERKLRALRKNETAVLEKDALVDEIVEELRRGMKNARARMPHAIAVPDTAPQVKQAVSFHDSSVGNEAAEPITPAPSENEFNNIPPFLSRLN